MRITAGIYRGRVIKALAGATTRPTTGRNREAWASTLAAILPRGFDGLSVLDAFAGSGALGLEALSRGAASVVFCESDRRALRILRENLSIAEGSSSSISVLHLDVLSPKAVRPLKNAGPYQLVLLDPPYTVSAQRLEKLLQTLVANDSLAPGAIVSYEHGNDGNKGLGGLYFPLACSPASLQVVSCKTYGITRIEYLRLVQEAQNARPLKEQ